MPVALLHCVLNYPTLEENVNLRMIVDLKKRYPDRVIGYSDHTLPADLRSLELAYVLGAEILEKHFTNDKNLPGNDHYHAMDKNDLITFKRNLERVEILLGRQEKRALSGLRCMSVASAPVSRRPTPLLNQRCIASPMKYR